jgi:hypothetical protein
MASAEEEIALTGTNRFSVSAFVSRISGKGLARTNRFRVIFVTPPITGNADDYRQISLNCEAAELPGRDLTTSDARIYGPTFKMPYMSNYNDVSFTFLCDASLVEKRVFDEWIAAINPQNSFDFEYRESYVSRVIIEQLTDDEVTAYSCELIEAYPIQVNAMPVTWGDDNFHRVTVTMTYRYWSETGSRDEQEQAISSSRDAAQQVRSAKANQQRLRNTQETVLRNRNRGVRDIPFQKDIPQPQVTLAEPNLSPPTVDLKNTITPPNINLGE